MKKYLTVFAVFAFLGIVAVIFMLGSRSLTPGEASERMAASGNIQIQTGDMIELPQPVTDGDMSIEKALTLRRSVRSYSSEPLNLAEVSQLLWSAQGITNEQGFRTAPSAGATFPLEMFMVVNNVDGLKKGIYHYQPHGHQLEFIRDEDVSSALFRACLSQSMITDGGAVLVFAADFERTTERYGERGIRYVHNEIGHAGQNVHLQAAAMDLGTVVIGAYRDDEVEGILQLRENLNVLYLMPVGRI